MTNEQARAWVRARYPVAYDALARFAAMVIAENERQNLIAASTVDMIWARHIVDSLQLIDHGRAGRWIDIGSGAGLPGIPIAIVRRQPILLVEPRRRRAAFLSEIVDALELNHAEIAACRIEQVRDTADIVSARAVAGVGRLIELAKPIADTTTRWIMPRGAVSTEDMDVLAKRFGRMFHVEHSQTSDTSRIVTADGLPR